MSGIRRLRPFDFSGRRLPPGRADRFQASVRNGQSSVRTEWQLRHGLRAFPGGPVDPDFAQLRPARSRVGEMSRTKSAPGIALGRWCTLGQTHYCAVDPARVPRPGAVDENPSCAHVVGLSLVIVAVLQFDATVDRSHAVKFGSRTGGTLALGDAGKIAGPSLCAGPGRGSPPLTPLNPIPAAARSPGRPSAGSAASTPVNSSVSVSSTSVLVMLACVVADFGVRQRFAGFGIPAGESHMSRGLLRLKKKLILKGLPDSWGACCAIADRHFS